MIRDRPKLLDFITEKFLNLAKLISTVANTFAIGHTSTETLAFMGN